MPLRQIVVEIAIAQIEGMVGRRHARRVGIPVEQVEGHRILTLEVVVDEIGPDQIRGAQHVEGRRHLRSVEIARFLHSRFDLGDLLLIDKHLEVAGIGEIDLCREQGCRADAPVTFLRMQRKRGGKQRAADAIADRIHLFLAGRSS